MATRGLSYGETVEGAQATGKLRGKRKSLTLHRGKPSLAERFYRYGRQYSQRSGRFRTAKAS